MVKASRLETVQDIVDLLGFDRRAFDSVCSRVDRCYRKREIRKPNKPDKSRVIYDPRGDLRLIQKALYRKLILPRVTFSPYSHAVRGRSPLTSIREHVQHTFLYTADVADFFPGIHFSRVTRLFLELGCSNAVARCLTKLCTADFALPQGFITSPVLADLVFRSADMRVGKLCESADASYTRFVDDLTVSASFNLEESGLPQAIGQILRRHGFQRHRKKDHFGNLTKGASSLGLRVNRGHPDVTKAYYVETEHRIASLASLAIGGEFEGDFYTRTQMWGRVSYVLFINPRRRRTLVPLWRRLDWRAIMEQAKARGYVHDG